MPSDPVLIANRYWWFPEFGKLLPVVSGGDGSEGDPPPADPPKAPPVGDLPRSFSQAELDAVASREKDQGKRAAEQAIATQLGVSIEDAKKIITAAKERDDADKSEAQKAREAADREKAAAESEKQQAARERHETRVERMLIRAGVDPSNDKRLNRALRTMEVEIGAEEKAISAAIEDLKKEEPAWFAATPVGDPPKGKPSDPPGTPPRQAQSEDAYTRGMDRAKRVGAGGQYSILNKT